MIRTIFVLVLLAGSVMVFLFSPSMVVLAQSQSGIPVVPGLCHGSAGDGKDAGCGWTDLLIEVNSFIRFLLYISAALAAVSFSYAGFLYMTSGGNPGQVEKAKGMFIKVIVGFLIALLAWLLVQTVLSSLGVNSAYSLLG